MAATSWPMQPRTEPGAKRPRTWDVDITIDELVSWDVLEQFMHDIPSEPAIPEQSPLGGDSLLGTMRGASESVHGGGCSHYPGTCASASGAGVNPALAHSMGSCWQQPGAVPALRQNWSSEFLPGMLLGPDQDGAGGDGDGFGAVGADGSRQAHKQRFVWTAELHHRFESAVGTLGIDHAKPQAISQLMNCDGEGAPTRQNIKSHLQKYRLLMQKRGKGGSCGTLSNPMTPSASCVSLVDLDEPSERGSDRGSAGEAAVLVGAASGKGVDARRVSAVDAPPSPGSGGAGVDFIGVDAQQADCANGKATAGAGVGEDERGVFKIFAASSAAQQTELEVHLARQEMNLKVQMDLQTRLHRHLLVQRQLQHQLESSFAEGAPDAMRWQV